MELLESYCPSVYRLLPARFRSDQPWNVCRDIDAVLRELGAKADSSYDVSGLIVVHRTASVDATAIISGPAFICAGATVGPHAVLRAGTCVGEDSHIGASVEIKQSMIGPRSAIAHLNYIGNSIVGEDVNVEAGAVIANHYNEKHPSERQIVVRVSDQRVDTGTNKFGALVGDHCRIGANAVTSPGTLLGPKTVVGRLELVQQ
ncbi:MAG TPA: LpxA family transferase [Candidatus Saccharimonadia bacterium]|nr:LpxA family transferase [Candidatus Saccharimonadia bacterium]